MYVCMYVCMYVPPNVFKLKVHWYDLKKRNLISVMCLTCLFIVFCLRVKKTRENKLTFPGELKESNRELRRENKKKYILRISSMSHQVNTFLL